MASLVIVQIAETPQGIAFEVMMQSSTRQNTETAVCQRLRSYATSFDKDSCRDLDVLPTLLTSRPVQTLATEEHATKAKGQNHHQQKVVEHIKTQHSRLANHRQYFLEQRMAKASNRRDAMLSARKVVAGGHFEAVKAKVDISHQRQAIATTALELRLEETDMRKEFTHRVHLAERSARAGQHNQHQKKVVEHLKTEHSRLANHKQHFLEQRMAKASDGREAMLSARKVVAGGHFEAVKAKVDISHQRQAIATTALALRLEETDMRKEFTHRVYLAERSARAGQHNQAVVKRLRQHEMAKERQAEELRSKSPGEKFFDLCLRLHDYHVLSRLQA